MKAIFQCRYEVLAFLIIGLNCRQGRTQRKEYGLLWDQKVVQQCKPELAESIGELKNNDGPANSLTPFII